MSEILYGCRLLRVVALLPDGSVPTTEPVGWLFIKTPNQANIQPQMTSAQSQELRGGDRLIARIEEEEELTGIDLSFTDAALNGEAQSVIDGGSFDDMNQTYTPRDVGVIHPGFAAELYVARYEEGSQHASDEAGYVKFTFPGCTGFLSGLNSQNRSFGSPGYTIRARDNQVDDLRCYKWALVNALPAPAA